MGDVKKSFCANFIRKSIFAKEAAEISQVANTSCRKQVCGKDFPQTASCC